MNNAQDQDFMENILKQRDNDVNLIADIMKDINIIAKDVLKEV